LKINNLCNCGGSFGDFPNTFSLSFPVCPLLSIHALSCTGRYRFQHLSILLLLQVLCNYEKNGARFPW
jgi:hypothetical protein